MCLPNRLFTRKCQHSPCYSVSLAVRSLHVRLLIHQVHDADIDESVSALEFFGVNTRVHDCLYDFLQNHSAHGVGYVSGLVMETWELRKQKYTERFNRLGIDIWKTVKGKK